MWNTIGHDHLTGFFEGAIRGGRLAHAYLLVGPKGVGKRTLALDVARALLCSGPAQGLGEAPCGRCRPCGRIAAGQHADVTIIGLQSPLDPAEIERVAGGAQRREVSIKDIRHLERLAALQPYEGAWRIFIFDGAEDLSEEASNALLKTLEEPPPCVMLFLLTANEEALLPTVRSRCQRLMLRPVPEERLAQELQARWSVPPDQASLLARLAQGRPGAAISLTQRSEALEARSRLLDWASAMAEAPLEQRFAAASELANRFARDRAGALDVLASLALWWRDMLMVKTGHRQAALNQDRLAELEQGAARHNLASLAGAAAASLHARELLELNVNSRLVLEELMLALPRAAVALAATKGPPDSPAATLGNGTQHGPPP